MRKRKHASRRCSRLVHIAAGGAGTCKRRACELQLLEGAGTRLAHASTQAIASSSVPWHTAGASPPRRCSFTSQPKAQARAKAELASCRCVHRRARPKHAPGALPPQAWKPAHSRRSRKRKHAQEQSARAAVGRFTELAVGTQQARRCLKAAHARRGRRRRHVRKRSMRAAALLESSSVPSVRGGRMSPPQSCSRQLQPEVQARAKAVHASCSCS